MSASNVRLSGVDGKLVGSARGSGGSQLLGEQVEFGRQAEPALTVQAPGLLLEAERKATLAEVAELGLADAASPEMPSMEDAELLDALPYLTVNLADAPQSLLRPLFEIIGLQIQLHPGSDDVTITLPGEIVPDLAEAAERIDQAMPLTNRLPRSEEAAENAVWSK